MQAKRAPGEKETGLMGRKRGGGLPRSLTVLCHEPVGHSRNGIYQLAKKGQDRQAALHGGQVTHLQETWSDRSPPGHTQKDMQGGFTITTTTTREPSGANAPPSALETLGTTSPIKGREIKM